jgi:hypothetical protein
MIDMTKIFKKLSLEQITSYWPLLTGHFLNAFYSALILKKLSGVQIDLTVEQETLDEILSKWNAINQRIVNSISSLSKEPRGPA